MAREELDLNEVEKVTGGSYVNVSMTIGEIIETNHNLIGILAQAGIPATGNRAVMGMTLYEIAEIKGIDPYQMEALMNDYLSSR